jgi:hypothetical protein
VVNINVFLHANCVVQSSDHFSPTPTGGFTQFSEDKFSLGLQYVRPELLQTLRSRGVTRVELVGPNIHKEPFHFCQLAREMPDLTHITFNNVAVSLESATVIETSFPQLRSVFAIGWATPFANLWAWRGLEQIVLMSCDVRDRYLNMMALLPHLKRVVLVQCRGYTKQGVMEFRQRCPLAVLVEQDKPSKPVVRGRYRTHCVCGEAYETNSEQAAVASKAVMQAAAAAAPVRASCWSGVVSGNRNAARCRCGRTIGTGGAGSRSCGSSFSGISSTGTPLLASQQSEERPSWHEPEKYIRAVYGRDSASFLRSVD